MSLRIPRPLRAACAAFALAAYGLPWVVGLAAHVAHGAEHAFARLGQMERRAAAMGVTHLDDAQDDHGSSRLVHTHGGAPHEHDAAVGALLVAAEDADEHSDEAATAPVELSSHVPAVAALAVLVTVERSVAIAEPHAASPRNLLPPPLPPPRA